GGKATATLTGSSLAHTVLSAEATGGSSFGGLAGNAKAEVTAIATADGGLAQAVAKATGDGANATATTQGLGAADLSSEANANGRNGSATAISMAAMGGASVTNTATAATSGGARSTAAGTYNTAQSFTLPNLAGGSNGLQAFASSNGRPSAATLNSVLATRPNVAAALGSGSSVLGLGVMGANYGAAAVGSKTYGASASYSFSLSSNSNLTLGLLGLTGYNGGFSSMSFTVVSGTTTLASSSFTSFAAAQSYFTDHPLALGTFQAGANSLVVSFSLTASTAKGADFAYLLAAKPVSSALGVVGNTGTSSTHRSPLLAERMPGFKAGLAGLRPTLGG
ncbi:hypothetical protein, partial [Ideonella azotifigens]